MTCVKFLSYIWQRRIRGVVTAMLCIAIMPASAFPLNLQIETYGHEEGVSQAQVSAIVQDPQGFIWFGTQDGLNRYDGYEFKVYKPDTNNPHTISNNSIRALLVDRKGFLWVGTSEGLNQFDFSSERFKAFKYNKDDSSSLSNNQITALLEEGGKIWVGTQDGLNLFDPAQQTFIRFKHEQDKPDSLSNSRVNGIYKDVSGQLWVATNRGINRYHPESQTFSLLSSGKNKRNEERLHNSVVHAMAEDADGRLIVGSKGGGIFVYNSQTERLSQYTHDPSVENDLPSNNIWSLLKDSQDRLWVGSDLGFSRITIASGQLVSYRSNNDPNSALSGDAVNAIFEDQQGILWVGTYSRGISKLSQTSFGHSLVSGQPTPSNPDALSRVRAFYVDRFGALWVGSNGYGLHKIDKSGRRTVYKHDPSRSSSLSRNEIFSIYEDKQGVVWVGTTDGWLNRYNRKNDSFTRFHSQPKDPNSIRHGRVRALLEDHQGIFWVGIEGGGLHVFDRKKQQFTHYHHDANKIGSLSHDAVFSIREDRSKNLWIATYGGGLNKLNREARIFEHYVHNKGDKNSLSSDYLIPLYEDSQEDVLWIGSNGGGLSRFETKTGHFTHFTEKDGLANNSVYGVIKDESGRMWITTNKGMSRLDLQTNKFKNYNERDGLQGDEYNGGAYYKSPDGKIYVGGINGYNAFYPDDIVDNVNKPKVYITELQLFNNKVEINKRYGDRILLPRSISTLDKITLSHKETIFSFQYIALNYIATSKNRYAYMMEGLEEDWNFVGDRRYASYSTLPPGDYVFRVKAANNNGVWNEEGASLAITITPPFWQTWWFRALSLMLLVLLVFAIYAARVKSIKAHNALLKNEVKARTVELEGQKESLEATLMELNDTKDAFKESSQVATGVLHNVGNLLNSVNTSASMIKDTLDNSVLQRYLKANEMLRSNIDNLEHFILNDPKGKKLLNYYLEMETPLLNEKQGLSEDTHRLISKISAIKEAITAQQRSAKGQGFIEALSLQQLIEDTITLQKGNIIENDIEVITHFEQVPNVKAEKAKLVQILFNLYKNAVESMDEAGSTQKTLTVCLSKDLENAHIKVSDTGLGIAADKLKEMFSYGFTTKTEGHGFGLHSCANYMAGMGGKMCVESEGLGQGATFILQLPLDNVANQTNSGFKRNGSAHN